MILKLNVGICLLVFLLLGCGKSINGIQTFRQQKNSEIKSSVISKQKITEQEFESYFNSDSLSKEKINEESLIASTENFIPESKRDVISLIKNRDLANFEIDWSANNLEECDIIVLKNGAEVSVKVIEIGLTEIKYKKCENLSGPSYTIEKSDVFMIKYSNGTKDVFSLDNSSENNSQSQNNDNNSEKLQSSNQKVTHWGAITGLICSLVGLFVFGFILGLLGIIFGVIAQGEIRKHPEKYKGNGMANAAAIIGILGIILWIGILLILYNGV